MKNIFKQLKKYPLAICFAVVILGGMLLDMTATNRARSELENRTLAQRPKMTAKSVLDNSFSMKYEEYINDQFIYRDQWITLKSVAETGLAKIENNGIIFGTNGQMFDKLTTIDTQRLNRNIDSINTFMKAQEGSNNVLMIVPSAYEILNSRYKAPMINISQKQEIDKIYSQFTGENIYTVNLVDSFISQNNSYLYYLTDHHWTSLGAYSGYKALCETLGLIPVDINTLPHVTVENFYGTHFSKAKKPSSPSDSLTYYETDTVSVNIDGKDFDDIYDLDALTTRDKYALYLRGNNGVTKITTTPSENKREKLLVIKDSFANSLVPFLTYNYNEIEVIDMRHFRGKLSQHLEGQNYSDILITYNFTNLASDVNIPLINH